MQVMFMGWNTLQRSLNRHSAQHQMQVLAVMWQMCAVHRAVCSATAIESTPPALPPADCLALMSISSAGTSSAGAAFFPAIQERSSTLCGVVCSHVRYLQNLISKT